MRSIIFFASHAAGESHFAIFDTPLRYKSPKKSDRFAAEGSHKSKMCFPCSVRSTFFVLLMEHGKHIFEIDLTPTVKMTFF